MHPVTLRIRRFTLLLFLVFPVLPGLAYVHSADKYCLSRFAFGTELADYQDYVFRHFSDDSLVIERTLKSLRVNLWIKMAKTRCPSNLVIRHWALIDLYSSSPDHAQGIYHMMQLLIRKDELQALWAEGHSYWLYTRKILGKWVDAFDHNEDARTVRKLIDTINFGFMQTAYRKNGQWYPAPFGDVRDAPLEPWMQELCGASPPENNHTLQYGNLQRIISGDTVSYTYFGSAIGMNTHVPCDTAKVKVVNGTPLNFRFYTGYDKKYSSVFEEWRDVLRKERRRSVKRLGREKE